jgi:hypothetical protein
MPPQNLPLLDKDYFELNANENEKMQEKLFALPYIPKRHKFTKAKMSLLPSLPRRMKTDH